MCVYRVKPLKTSNLSIHSSPIHTLQGVLGTVTQLQKKTFSTQPIARGQCTIYCDIYPNIIDRVPPPPRYRARGSCTIYCNIFTYRISPIHTLQGVLGTVTQLHKKTFSIQPIASFVLHSQLPYSHPSERLLSEEGGASCGRL